MTGRAAAAAAAALAWAACGGGARDRRVHRDVRAVARAEGAALEAAIARAAAHGPAAIPDVETELQAADVPGRLNLLGLLRRLAHPEAVPLALHRARFDPDAGVRAEAEWTLRQWAASGGPAGAAARAALRVLEQERGDTHPG